MKMKYDSIIFDMDGTIWDTEKQVCEAWNTVLADAGHPKRVTGEELAGYMGLPMTEIARKMFNTDNYEEVAELFERCLQYENEYIAAHGAILYPDLINTLEALSAKIPLFIASNCQSGYIEAFFDAYDTKKYFRDYICFGDNKKLKDHNIRLLVERNGLKSPVYIGDTKGDGASAKAAGIDFVWASYGFGHADEYVARVDCFADIPRIIS